MQLNRQSGFLDLLRSVAIALVLLRHGVSTSNAAHDLDAPSSFAHTLAANGWLGVDLFFVLSGYLLCTQILNGHESKSWLPRNFYLRRAVRILPPYLAVVLACWLGALAPVLGSDGVLSPFVLLSHLLFLQDYAGAPLMVTLWSLATEEKFYLALPLLVAGLVRMRHGHAALLLLCLSVIIVVARTWAINGEPPDSYSTFFWAYRAPFHFAIDGLLIGTSVAFSEKHLHLQSPGSRLIAMTGGALALCGALILLGATAWLTDTSFAHSSIAIWCFSICCGVLILTVRGLNVENQLPSAPRAVTYIAALSYSLYLVHYPVAMVAQRLFTSGDNRFMFWAFYLSLSLLLAWILNSVTEVPFRGLRQRLRRHQPQNADGAVAQTTPAV